MNGLFKCKCRAKRYFAYKRSAASFYNFYSWILSKVLSNVKKYKSLAGIFLLQSAVELIKICLIFFYDLIYLFAL